MVSRSLACEYSRLSALRPLAERGKRPERGEAAVFAGYSIPDLEKMTAPESFKMAAFLDKQTLIFYSFPLI